VRAVRKLKGKVIAIEKTGESIRKDGENWEKCIFTLELTSLSENVVQKQIPASLKGKRVKITRYCFYTWHFMLGIEKTIEPEETEAIFEENLS
jgi:predicted GTPase